jgi:predicted dehydrogenase
LFAFAGRSLAFDSYNLFYSGEDIMEKRGFALIGCGVWGAVHARTYASSPRVRLVATCDAEENRAAEFARIYGAEHHTKDWREILRNPAVDAVSVATPDFAHGEIVLAALEAGKHVLVEKPLATTLDECRRILAARDARGVKLMVDFHNRWNLPFVNIRRMVESGELGTLLMMNIRLNDTLYVPTRMLSWAAKSSAAQFLGSHVVDLIRWISGAEVGRVYAVSRSEVLRKRGVETPDFFQSTLELSNGGTAVVENCWIVNERAPSVFDFQAEFVGTRGSVYVNASHHRMIEKYSEDSASFPDVAAAADLHGKPVGFAVAAIEHFIDCVNDDRAPVVTGEDGLRAAEVVLAIEASAHAGSPVELRG